VAGTNLKGGSSNLCPFSPFPVLKYFFDLKIGKGGVLIKAGGAFCLLSRSLKTRERANKIKKLKAKNEKN